MSIHAVGGVRAPSAAAIAAEISHLRRQERQLVRQLTELVSEGGVDEGAGIKQRALEAQIVVVQMRIAQLEARRSEAVQAALGAALPALHADGAGAPSAVDRAGGASGGGLDVRL